MRYIEQSGVDGEELVGIARFHWLYTIWSVFDIVFGFYLMYTLFSSSLFFGAMGFLLFNIGIIRFIKKWTTEIAVTNMRLVYKRGWIARQTDEISTKKLEEINLSQGTLGRIFGYGRLVIKGTGMGAVSLPNIADPLAFRKAILSTKEI